MEGNELFSVSCLSVEVCSVPLHNLITKGYRAISSLDVFGFGLKLRISSLDVFGFELKLRRGGRTKAKALSVNVLIQKFELKIKSYGKNT
jgi:hypothetical protein